MPSVRRAVATGIIDKASVVVVVIAGEIIIEIVAQPLMSDVGPRVPPTMNILGLYVIFAS